MKRLVGIGIVAVAAAVAGVVALGVGDDGDRTVAPAEAAVIPVTPELPAKSVSTVREPDPGYLGAFAIGPSVALFDGPRAATPSGSLGNPTHEGMPLSFAIRDRVGDRYLASLPVRPNGTTAWIDVDAVSTHIVPNRIVVDLSDRRLRAYRADRKLLDEPVAVGSSATPTPVGEFYVDISVVNPIGPYGDHMLSVAGFSDVLHTFGGGIGQIAIHGWHDPSVVGQAVSNGCVRMPNDVIRRLAEITPVGTPVSIVA